MVTHRFSCVIAIIKNCGFVFKVVMPSPCTCHQNPVTNCTCLQRKYIIYRYHSPFILLYQRSMQLGSDIHCCAFGILKLFGTTYQREERQRCAQIHDGWDNTEFTCLQKCNDFIVAIQQVAIASWWIHNLSNLILLRLFMQMKHCGWKASHFQKR